MECVFFFFLQSNVKNQILCGVWWNGGIYLWFKVVLILAILGFCRRPGLSKFFGGKSRSFSSLADVSSVSDLAKPNNPYAKRRRLGLNSSLDRHRSYPPISRASVAGISKKSSNRSSTLTVAVKLGSLTEEDKDYAAALPGSRISGTRTTPSRSFSLTDLPVVSNPSSPPSRRSFAHPWTTHWFPQLSNWSSRKWR